MDELQILIQAILSLKDTTKSKQQILSELPKLEKQLQSGGKAKINITAGLDITKSKNLIQTQLNDLTNQSKAPTIKIGVDTSAVKKAIKDTSTQISHNNKNNNIQVFDSAQLEEEGRKYFTKTTNIIDRAKKYFLQNGALSVDISSLETAKGQIQSFTALIEESTGVIKKFNFERGKINTGYSKPNYGFVQTDSLKSIDRNAGANLESTLNFLTRIDEKIMSIQSKSTKQANPLKEGTVYYDNYNKKLSETVTKIEEIKNANKTLSTEQKNEIQKMITELSLYAKEQQKLAYPPMISSTSIDDSVEKAKATLSTLEQKWKTQGILTGEFKTQVVNLISELDQVGNTEGLKKYNTSLKLVQESAKQLLSTEKQYTQFKQDISDAITKLNSLNNSSVFSKNASNSQVAQIKQDIINLSNEYQSLKTKMQGNISPAGLETFGAELNKLKTRFNSACANAEQFEKELKDDSGAEQLAQKVSVLTARIETFRKANSKSEKLFGGEYDRILSQLSDPNIDLETYNRLNKEFQKLRLEINKTNKAGQSFFEKLKNQAIKFTSWMTLTGVVAGAWHDLQKMVSEVVELDSAMSNLKKVTDETDVSYSKFLKNSIQQARDLKMDLSDLIDQTAEWAKKGYNLNESSILSKASGIYSVVGEVDNATAVQDLTTVMKSYDMTVEEAMDIVDKFNNISNNYSVTAANIGEILSNSISSLSVAGNSLDESIAMGTTITEITGDASEAGNTLKVLSMRLRGASTEIKNIGESTDGMVESTSKLREKVLALTNVDGTGGFDIMADSENFKSTYQIMQGISEVWQDISDVNQAALIELIAGKQRGNTVSALLTNMAQANNILSDSLNSSGSAMEEYNVYLDSLPGKIQGIKTEFSALSEALVDDSSLKGLLDIVTSFLKCLTDIIDNLGLIKTLGLSVATVLSFKNVGERLNTPVYVQPQLICA